MSTLAISVTKLEALEASKQKLLALEAGGVDNWSGYSSAMEPYWKAAKTNEKIKKAVYEAIGILQESGYEPSETGAGFKVPHTKYYEACQLLKHCLEELSE